MERRRFLTTAVTFLAGIGAGFAAVPFIRSWRPTAKSVPLTAKIEFPKLLPGQVVAVDRPWGGVIYILHRTQEMLEGLKHFSGLRDPESKESEQPEFAKNEHRSIKPEFLVVEAECTHLGCTVGYVTPGVLQFGPGQEHGCFYCPCHSSVYDLAGRVVSGVPAKRNLVVPYYEFTSEREIQFEHPNRRT